MAACYINKCVKKAAITLSDWEYNPLQFSGSWTCGHSIPSKLSMFTFPQSCVVDEFKVWSDYFKMERAHPW